MSAISGLTKIYYDTWRTMSIFHRITNEPDHSYSMHIRAILVLYNQKKCTQKKLARTLGIKASAFSSRVDKLVKQGLAKQIPNEDDRREFFVALTPLGIKAAVDEMNRRYAAMDKMFSQLSEKDQKELIKACTIMQKIQGKIKLDIDT
jgi:DNA-binding MarR family transcriptional regulator